MAKKYMKLKHSPTLNTVLMVEEALKKAQDSIISIPQLKRMLPKQINHNTLMIILEYLEQSNKIVVSLKGLTWIQNSNGKMSKSLKTSYNYPQDFPK